MRLKDKVAIVTGGARGIGKAISELFAQEGAKVYIWDLLDEGAETAEGINANGGQAVFQKISVTDREAVTTTAASIAEECGKIDILINNAGILRDKSLAKMTDAEWDAVMNVNLKALFICTQVVSPYMKANNYGRIVLASSVNGLRGGFGQSNYSAAKAAVLGLAKTWTLELGKYGITTNCVAPGYTHTAMTESIPEAFRKEAIKQIPVRRIGQPIDIAHGYLYLASEEAGFVSGICLTIDGGWSR